ncbi:MAG: Ig-like domain-containing protein [Pirellulales bacterium]
MDDLIADGTQPVIITGSAAGFSSGADVVNVTDNEVAQLTVAIDPPGVVLENAGPNAIFGMVFRNTPIDQDLVVTLISSDLSEAAVPQTVIIPAGQASARFAIRAIDEFVSDGLRTVTITAAASGFRSGSDTLDVASIDNVVSYNRLGDRNLPRDQGQIIIESNRITNSLEFAIRVDSAGRDAGGNQPHPGGVRNLSVLNGQRLVPGIMLENNVISLGGIGGILFSGDPNPAGSPLAAVAFGRVVNNTIFGQENPAGVGIRVSENASPTILNNIFANLARSIEIDGTSASTVVGGSLYQNILTPFAGPESFGKTLLATEALFRDAENGNFYLAPGTFAIDSSIDNLPERPALAVVHSPMGIPVSPILAPDFDLEGQLRVDDPTVSPPPGLGGSVFKDRGAIERADFTGPVAVLLDPIDNDVLDQNLEVNLVHRVGQAVSFFAVQLVDPLGSSIDDATVVGDRFTLRRNGVLLQRGLDYIFSYDATNNVARFIAAAGVWLNGNQYTISLDNGVQFDRLDPSRQPVGIRDLAGNLLQANAPDGFTDFNIILDSVHNDAPVIHVQGPVPQPVDEEGLLVFSAAGGNAITVFDVDAGLAAIEMTLSTAYGTLTLAGTSGLVFLTGDGVDDAVIRFRATLADMNAALDGLSFTAATDFESPELATIEIEVNDLGHSGPGGAKTGRASVKIDVNPLNDAPVLNNTGAPFFPAILEDLALVDNVGTPISAMLATGANGDPITDVDANALEGIAVVNVAGTNGVWQFSINGGASWQAFGAVTAANTRLLRDSDLVRFLPNLNFHGSATLDFHAWDRTSGFAGGTADLTLPDATGNDTAFSVAVETASLAVTPVNDAPVVNVPAGPLSTDEDVPLVLAAPSLAITVSDVDADEGTGQLRLSLTASNGVLTLATTAGLTVSGNGTSAVVATGLVANINVALDGLVFRPDLDFAGPASITLVVNDLGNTGAGGPLESTAVIDIIVDPVQDAPVLDASGTPAFASIFEDMTVATNNGSTVSAMLASGAGGDPISDVDAGALEGIAIVGITGTSNGLWQYSLNAGSSWTTLTSASLSNARLLRPSDRVRFLPNLHFNGTVALTFHAWDQTSGSPGGTANLSGPGGTGGGSAFSLTGETATLTVLPVNDPPSFSLLSHTVDEDSGPQSVSNFAFAISMGPPDESGQSPLEFLVTNNSAGLFLAQPSIDTSGTLTYTPAPNAFGVATVRVRLRDDGGTANGGVDTSFERITTITIDGINDAPTLDAIPNANLPVDAPEQIVNLTGISAGPGESQQLSVTASSSNPALIPDPIVTYTSANTTGTLAYTPAAGIGGTAIITVTVTDDGGTVNGGTNTTIDTFFVNVGGANNSPTATAATVGTAEDTDVTITLEGTDPENDPLTAVIAALPAGGRLFQTADGITRGAEITSANTEVTDAARRVIYVPDANNNGSPYDTFRFLVRDGQDSPEAVITVNVTPVNDAPSFIKGPDQRVNMNSGPRTVVGWATGMSAGPANEAGQTLTFQVTGNSNSSLFAVQPAINAAGTLSYTPAAGMVGTATITVVVVDNGGTANGGVDTSLAQTFTINVNAAPTANGESYILGQSTSAASITGEGVLANDTDPDGNPLTAVLVTPPARGTVALNANGSFTYTKGSNFAGLDRFTYRANDGLANSSVATVAIISYEASLVQKLYQQVLGRDPEDSGLQFWTTRIMNGERFSLIAESIFESDERLNPIIRQFYRDFLLREADLEGLIFWRDQVWKRDGGPENVIAGMIGSPEFFQSSGGTNTGWVTQLYRRLLGREPEQSGRQFWVDALDQGRMTRQQVVLGFVRSDENFRNLITGWFNQYLGRQPLSTELTNLVGRMGSGASHREVQLGIIDSDEYRNTPPPPLAGTARRLIF